MQDWYSNDEATAAHLAEDPTLYDNDGPEDPTPGSVRQTTWGSPLADAVASALAWSIAWAPADIAQTAPGVVGFDLAKGIDPAQVAAILTRAGFDTIEQDGQMFARRAVAGVA